MPKLIAVATICHEKSCSRHPFQIHALANGIKMGGCKHTAISSISVNAAASGGESMTWFFSPEITPKPKERT